MSNSDWGAIPRQLAEDVSLTLKRKFNVQTGFKPVEWNNNIKALTPLPEKTVSGSIVAFSDGADDVPLKSCKVTIAPTLDGVSSVDVIKGGYNFIDASTAENGNLNISTGNVDTTSTSWKTTDFMPLFAGDFFFTWVSSSTYFQVKWVAYDSNKTRIDGESTATWTSVYSKQFTFPTGTAFVRFCWSVVVSGNPVTREDIRLNRGTVDLGYTEYVQPTIHTASLGRTVCGGQADVVNGTGTDEYTFDLWDGTQNYNVSDNLTNVFRIYMAHAKPLPDPTAVQCICEGYTFPRAGWSSDTVSFYSDANNFTLKLPKTEVTTLAEAKAWLAEHNVYFLYATTPEDFTFTPVPIISRLGDNTMWGDGDLSVVYRYESGDPSFETVLSSNPLLELTGVNGTDVTRTIWTYTATDHCKIKFHSNTQVRTNTSSNDGYFTVKKNDTVILTTYANTSTTTQFPIPDIELESGDTVTITGGFDNYHTSCWFDVYSTITILHVDN